MYFFEIDSSEARLRNAEQAVQRAFELAPELPEAHLAMGYYHYHGHRNYDQAQLEFAIAEQGLPGDAPLYLARAYLHRRTGQLELSAAVMERAIELDPRNPEQFAIQASTYSRLRDYARAEQYRDRVLEIEPNNSDQYMSRAMTSLERDGDVSALKAAAANPPGELQPWGKWLAWVASIYERDYETALAVLDDWDVEVVQAADEYQYDLKSTLSGETHWLAGNEAAAEQKFELARQHLEDAIQADPENFRFYTALGRVLAGLGDTEAAVRMINRSKELMPRSVDSNSGAVTQVEAAKTFAMMGDADQAITELDEYLAGLGNWSIEGLEPDPRFDLIRDDPRFQELVEKYRRQ